MFIKKMVSQHRRDFIAIYECEHCRVETTSSGYDDDYFHVSFIPNMICPSCYKTSGAMAYQPRNTKYSAEEIV